MLILPAIDLKDGRCVRLAQGDFNAVTAYGDPVEQAKAFADAGAEWIHVVDLDGAAAGRARQFALVGAIARAARVAIQCGGGVRARADVAALIDAGAARVVVGSAAVTRPDDLASWLNEFGPDRLCAAFDGRASGGDFIVVTQGWTQSSGVLLDQAIARFPAGALRHALVTDVARDGMLSGPNTALYAGLVRRFPDIAFQASGGVATLGDLEALRASRVAGAVVGRALYEQQFTLEEALASQTHHRLP